MTHTFFMAQTMHGGNIICLIISVNWVPRHGGSLFSFSCNALDEDNLTQAQEDCLQLDHRALYYLTCAIHDVSSMDVEI